jgi:hypothetical protein
MKAGGNLFDEGVDLSSADHGNPHLLTIKYSRHSHDGQYQESVMIIGGRAISSAWDGRGRSCRGGNLFFRSVDTARRIVSHAGAEDDRRCHAPTRSDV